VKLRHEEVERYRAERTATHSTIEAILGDWVARDPTRQRSGTTRASVDRDVEQPQLQALAGDLAWRETDSLIVDGG